ncbi:DUF1285 domain-containing protein [Marinobacter sp.]|uniref:DUF1285 domain-containing protein n=1 Tax=Marinobacter sp. TaxID=50741 RepID=UPI00384A5E18
MNQDPSRIEEQVADASKEGGGRPPLEKWNPDFSGDIDIRIARNGEWFYQGEKMQREALVRLFASILRREKDGEYYLVTPVEKWRIEVEDTPLIAHSPSITGQGPSQIIEVTTNTGEVIRIGQKHPISVDTYPDSEEPRPLVYAWHGLEARLVTTAFYHLVEYVTENPDRAPNNLGVWSDGVFFELGSQG